MVEQSGSDDFYRAIGAKVRSARIAAQLSQADLAARVGLTRSSVANLEAARQRTSLYHFVLISKALETDIADLLPPSSRVHGSYITQSVARKLANSPETAQHFVRGAVARLHGNGSIEAGNTTETDQL